MTEDCSKINFKNYTIEELCDFMVTIGEKSYIGKQIFKWLHNGATSFDEMSNISKPLRKKLSEIGEITLGEIELFQKSKLDDTIKYLIKLKDDTKIEAVYMKYKHGNSICISSQVGCRMGCTFCASGKEGLIRNLTAGEMIEQINLIEKDTTSKISNVVIMGIGEPFDNYDNLVKFIKIINHKDGPNISKRKITVSTCGIIPNIQEFSKDMPQVNLAISLHNPIDEERSKIMPINNKYSINELIKVAKEYTRLTGRRITFEYTLIDGVNDTNDVIYKLCNLLKGGLFHVNLIPLNNIIEEKNKGSSKEKTEEIMTKLEGYGIESTARRELGSDIDAACGQLRLSVKEYK